VSGICESLLLMEMGADNPWPEMFRGLAAGAILAALLDLVVQAARRLHPRGRVVAGLMIVAFLNVPGALRPYEDIVLGAPMARAQQKPGVTVMTSLPIIWGEQGAFSQESRPTASWRTLEEEFRLRPIDFLDEVTLAPARLLLLAQPRPLAPTELTFLDSWVRRGGRILILADPLLVWPTTLAPGDVRRPVAGNMAAPLLDHWGVSFGGAASNVDNVRLGRRQLRVNGAAALRSRSSACRQEATFVLDCRIGQGRAIVVADSDLLHDSTTLPVGTILAARHNRLSDNMLIIADWLDRLAGVERRRASGEVQWLDPGADRSAALFIAMLPLASILLLTITILIFASRRSFTDLSTGRDRPTPVRTNQE
jgi:hypothetical protein